MYAGKQLAHLQDEDLQIIKRDGSIVPFNKTKIRKAIINAMRDGGVYLPDIARIIANDAENYFLKIFSVFGRLFKKRLLRFIRPPAAPMLWRGRRTTRCASLSTVRWATTGDTALFNTAIRRISL